MDAETVRRAQQGDEDALAGLTSECWRRLLPVAQGILHDRDLAEDATQQSVLRIWRGLDGLRDPERFAAWSYRTLVNACYEELRRPDVRLRAGVGGAMLPDPEATSGDDMLAVADRDELDRALRRLSIEQRVVVVLHHYLGLRLDEVAAILGVPAGTVASRAHRALDSLRAEIEASHRSADATNGTDQRSSHAMPAGVVGPRGDRLPIRSRAGNRIIVVAQDGTGDVATIAAGVAVAADGDVIAVRPGTYRESVIVERDITIVGEGCPAETVLDFRKQPAYHVVFGYGPESSWSCAPAEATIPFGFLLERTTARLVDLTLRGPRIGTAVLLHGGAPTLSGLQVELDGPWVGPPTFHHFAFIWGRSRARIQDCRARSHIHIAGGSSPLIEHCSLGAMLSITGPCTDPIIRRNHILTMLPREFWSIGIARAARPIVEGNEISLGYGDAITIQDPLTDATVRGNEIHGSQTGIRICDGAVATIEGNAIDDNAVGIAVVHSRPLIVDNRIRYNRAGGIVIVGDGPTVCEGNALTANGRGNHRRERASDPPPMELGRRSPGHGAGFRKEAQRVRVTA